ncbi:hypothetical protein JG687_00003739 [Phytophthora cactorum]|uniref:RING-type domain-containing protein n=2 Tax=Phytophthora cactorum TaxID=29920 RepID=A0A8T1UT80_9STRA|nr:hypothetical protein JG687_00003739 [Phytophthora cactorum]
MPRSIDDLLFGASSDEEDAGDYAGYSGSSDDDDSSDSESEYNVGSFAQQHSSANLALPSANTANTAQTFAAAENDDDDVQILSAAEAAAEVAAAARRALEDPNTSRKRKRPMVQTKPVPTECTICCEDCTIVGRHRLVALKCGHLFGRKCIERWISEKRTCPNCSAIVRRTDICLLFSDHVAVVDNAGLEDMTNKFEEEKKKSSKLEKEMTGLKKQLQARAREATRLSAELARFKKAIADMQCKAAQERLSSDTTFNVRDISIHPSEKFVLTVAFDGKLAMTSLQDKKVALQIVLPPDGSVAKYDYRKPTAGEQGIVKSFSLPQRQPVHSMKLFKTPEDVANAGNGSVGAPPFLHVPSDQACFSLASNQLHSHQVVVSSRSTPMKHSLFDLRTVGLGRLSPRMEVTGHKAPSVLSRSAMWSEADGTSVVASWSHDVEGVTMWNVATQHERSGRMSGSFKASISQKAFLSPTDVAELTAAAVAALPSTLSQANLALKKSTTSAHRTENGDIVHHHQATHRGGNATLVTSTTTTIHHMGGAGKSGVAAPAAAGSALTPQPQFSLHSHGHHHHHHLSHGASLLANGSLSGLANGSLGGNGLDGSVGSGALAASPTFQGDLNQIDAGLNSEDADVQLEAAKKLRVLLSSERDLLIRQMLEKNWTPRLIKWLRLRDRPTLQVEALWALTNIAAGATDNTSVLLQNGVIPTLVSLLDSSNEEVLEQSVWVLGNLAGEGAATRDLVLSAGALTPLVNNLKKTSWDRLSLLRILTWTISNLCDGQPRPVFDIGLILPYLAKMLTSTDTEILSHVCWAFSHLCDGPSTHIQAVVDSDVCFRLVELLSHSSWRVTKPALRAIGNIVCAEDDHDYTQHIIECGAVPSLRRLIAHSNREIQKEACWTLSNIAAGTVDQIQCVLDSGCIPSLMGLAASDATDAEVKSEACWVVLNATSCGSDSQIEYLVNQGCIQILGNLLEETSMVMMALEGLERILQVGELEAKRTDSPNPYASLMASANIETLVSHKSATVAKRASRIWQQHFVTCAICLGPFSKHSNDTFFCAECKCNVCKNCDCTVFHLKYQESLWKEETEKETSEKQARQASKRSKRQKKRQRTKERKAALLRGQKAAPGSNGKGSKHNQQQKGQPQQDNSSSDEASSTKSGGGGGGGSRRRRHDADDSASENGSNGSNEEEEDGPGEEEEAATEEEVNVDVLDEMVNANDKLVSYLLETGSIMALAERLDLEDDSTWIVAEKDRTAIHA